eukprot:2617031-Amphidinium_carterae.1
MMRNIKEEEDTLCRRAEAASPSSEQGALAAPDQMKNNPTMGINEVLRPLEKIASAPPSPRRS